MSPHEPYRPSKQRARIGLRAMIGGMLAAFMTGTLAGIFV